MAPLPVTPAPGSTPAPLQQLLGPSLTSASQALVRAYRPLLEPLGLTYPQYLVMLALWQQAPLSVGQLKARTRLDLGTLSPLLKRLAGKGLLLRARARDDERRRVIALSRAGSALQQQASAIPAQIAAASGLSQGEVQQLQTLCEHLLASLDPT